MRRPLQRIHLMILAAGLSVGVLPSCGSGQKPVLTSEEARHALVVLLRNDPSAFQRPLDADKLSRQPVKAVGPAKYFLRRIPNRCRQRLV